MQQYRLADGVTLQEQDGRDGGILSVACPKRIIRLSSGGLKTVKILCGQISGPETAGGRTADFAAGLENSGILTRLFPGLRDEALPRMSVVIPTYNRREMLAGCVRSLLDMDYPREKMEIIVVDDASPLPVEVGYNGPSLRVVRLDTNGGPAAARNQAVKLAKGEIIAFLDDDCLAHRGWLRALVPCFQYPDVAAAGGRVEPAGLTRPLDRYEQFQSPLMMGQRQRKVRKGSSLSYLATCNLLVKKDSFTAAGGFDPRLRVGEDVDLCWRLLENGGHIYYIPGGSVQHHHRSGLLPFLKRRYDYGQSEAMLQARHPGEKRRLVYFPGNGLTALAAIAAWLLSGPLTALAAGTGLAVLNLIWQSALKWKTIKKAGYNAGLPQVTAAVARSQAAGLYHYCQHFSRYYSLPVITAALFTDPRLALIFLAFLLLPAVVDFTIKKPSLPLLLFIFYHLLDDIFYQAGVLRGCFAAKNWRPLSMTFVKS
ncbi:mycofactocin biosynthesis glycosyltransferase MftF [Pelotomaculum propionicicum]|uniref:mycofactocin biosynthesis glycosyltransferase MftF n=1 Tax=Pelotomaculum propionicicum TaxID=258475 RepID=UPI003B799F84